MKKYLWIFLVNACILVVGCSNKDNAIKLSQIDELLEQDNVDSANLQFSQLSLSEMKSKADSAYFFLVQTEVFYRKYIESTSDSGITSSLIFYKEKPDIEKLARAYYYKGVTTYNKNRMPQTIHLLKLAEELADQTNNLLLRHKIYEKLSYYNGEAFEKELYKYYAQKALNIAMILNSKERQVTAMQYLTAYYLQKGNRDSARIFANECIPMMDTTDSVTWAYQYTNLGRIYEKDDPQLAKIYLKKAIAIKGIPNAYKTLANIYLREDSMDKVREMWEQALYSTRHSKMNTMRVDIFNAMRQQAMEHGDFRQANALADSAANWMKRYYEVQQQDRLAEIQAKYDKERAEQEILKKIYGWGLAALIICALVIVWLGRNSYRGMKTAKELAETRSQLADYTRKAEELEASGQQNTKEVARLNRKISELQQRQAGILANGKRLYDSLRQGATTVHWGKADFTDFIEYYKLKDLSYVNDLQTDYDRLSPKYMFFAIMEHEGRPDEEIMRVMGISESTMRSTRSRINNKMK